MTDVQIGEFVNKRPEPASSTRDPNDLAALHGLVHDVHQRLFTLQLEQAEKIADLSFRVAKSSVDILTVVAETSAAVLGKTVSGSDISETLMDLVRKIKQEFSPGTPGGDK